MGAENNFLARLVGAVRKVRPEALLWKTHGSENSAGRPDLYLQDPEVGPSWVELKAIGELPSRPHSIAWGPQTAVTALQAEALAALAAAGSAARVLLFVRPLRRCFSFDGRDARALRHLGLVFCREDLESLDAFTTRIRLYEAAGSLELAGKIFVKQWEGPHTPWATLRQLLWGG